MPHVSVVIPAFNCAPYIATAVESVLGQYHQDLDVIVVDDGSTDGTIQALERYRDRLQLLQQANAGAAAARNHGLSAAKGELVAFLDADDWWDPSRLSAQLAALQAFPDGGLVFSDFAVADVNATRILERGIRWKYGVVRDASIAVWANIFSSSQPVRWRDGEGCERHATAYQGHVGRWLFRGNMINTCSVLLRREVIEQVGGFDQTLETEEDYDYWLRVAQRWPLVYVDEPLLTFRRRPGQLTQADRIERVVRNVVTVVERTSERLANELDPREIAERLARVHLDLGIICLRQGRGVEARHHFGVSLCHRPGSILAMAFASLAYLPSGVLSALERTWRLLRGRPKK